MRQQKTLDFLVEKVPMRCGPHHSSGDVRVVTMCAVVAKRTLCVRGSRRMIPALRKGNCWLKHC